MPGDWTAQRVEAGIDELRRCIEEVKSLVPGDTYNAPAVHNVNLSIRKTIQKVFGQGSVEYNEYKDYRIDDFPPVYESRTDLVKDKLKRRDFPEKKDKAVAMLEGLISSLEQQPMDLEADQYTGRVFIVHGRDAEAKKQVRTFLEQAKLEPVILDEQANKGQTVIEKFEGNADVDFAVVLLTPDDKGSLADSPGKATKPRPATERDLRARILRW